jgi:hypothetical protein
MGKLAWTEANEAVVRKHASTLMQKHHVRRTQIGTMLNRVVLAYFTPSDDDIAFRRITESHGFAAKLRASRHTGNTFLGWLFRRGRESRWSDQQ